MPVSVNAIFTRAQDILLDAGAVRWPLPELARWLNDGLRDLSFLKPNATSETVTLSLIEGTLQRIPDAYSLMIRANCNMNGTERGSAVTIVTREILDAQKPNWHNPARTPYRRDVRHVIADFADPTVFYVYPGNDGTGEIEAVMSRIPDPVSALPDTDPNEMAAWVQQIQGIQRIYQNCLTDYVLSKAFTKDQQLAGAAERANAHMAAFNGALTARLTVEGVANVNTTNG